VEVTRTGAIRVKVYVGYDAVSKKRLYLDGTVPAGPHAAREAEQLRTKFLSQVDERRARLVRERLSARCSTAT
jgi:hypothetical protein